MAREEKVIIRLTTEIKEEFEELAASYGMTVSALGSYVIGKFIADQRSMKNLNRQLQETVFNTTAEMAKDENMDFAKALELASTMFTKSQLTK